MQSEIADLVEDRQFLTSVLAASGDCIKVLGLDGQILFMNNGGLEVLELGAFAAVRGKPWLDFWKGAHSGMAAAALASARDGIDSRFEGAALTALGSERFWDVRATPIRDPAGTITHVLVISRDITQQRRIEVQKEMLPSELEHRIRNILAMVVAVARQTLKPPATLEASAAAFVARMIALANAQIILTQSSWEAADISSIVGGALKPHQDDGMARRFRISGPVVQLTAGRSLSLVLAMHELATNAAKYGALTNPDGVVHLTWRIGPEGPDGTLRLELRETGGPVVVPPTRRGFGSRLVEDVLAAEFGGTVEIAYEPARVRCVLTAPVIDRRKLPKDAIGG